MDKKYLSLPSPNKVDVNLGQDAGCPATGIDSCPNHVRPIPRKNRADVIGHMHTDSESKTRRRQSPPGDGDGHLRGDGGFFTTRVRGLALTVFDFFFF